MEFSSSLAALRANFLLFAGVNWLDVLGFLVCKYFSIGRNRCSMVSKVSGSTESCKTKSSPINRAAERSASEANRKGEREVSYPYLLEEDAFTASAVCDSRMAIANGRSQIACTARATYKCIALCAEE